MERMNFRRIRLWEVGDETSSAESHRSAQSCFKQKYEGIHFTGHQNASKAVMKTSLRSVIAFAHVLFEDWVEDVQPVDSKSRHSCQNHKKIGSVSTCICAAS